jgi:hypothetical protein
MQARTGSLLDGVYLSYNMDSCPDVVSHTLAAVSNTHVTNPALSPPNSGVRLVNAPKQGILQARYGNDNGGILSGETRSLTWESTPPHPRPHSSFTGPPLLLLVFLLVFLPDLVELSSNDYIVRVDWCVAAAGGLAGLRATFSLFSGAVVEFARSESYSPTVCSETRSFVAEPRHQ